MNDHEYNNPWGDDSAQPADASNPAEPTHDDPLAGLAAAAAAQPGPTWHAHGPRTDAHGRLLDELECRGCGYNLMSQMLTGGCPECGQPVEWSARGDRLGYSDPRWLASLRLGMLWFIFAIVGAIVLAVMDSVISAMIVSAGSRSNYSPPRPGQTGPTGFNQYTYAPQTQNTAMAVSIVLGLIASGLFLFAVWQLTAPEPGRADEQGLTARSLFRWGWVASAVFGTAGNVTMLASQNVALVMSGIGAVVWIVVFFTMFVYLRRLALRMPDTGLAGQTRLVMWSLVSCYGVIIVSGIAMVVVGLSVTSSSTLGGLALAGGCAMCVSGLGLIVFFIWGFVLTFFYYTGFSRALRFAVHARSRVREVPSLG